jgi:hypothetical protein
MTARLIREMKLPLLAVGCVQRRRVAALAALVLMLTTGCATSQLAAQASASSGSTDMTTTPQQGAATPSGTRQTDQVGTLAGLPSVTGRTRALSPPVTATTGIPPTRQPDHDLPLLTLTHNDMGRLANLSFGKLATDGTCFWIAPPVPTASNPMLPIVWPLGYTARSNPLRILDSHGTVVASPGQRISSGGFVAKSGIGKSYTGPTQCFLGRPNATILG